MSTDKNTPKTPKAPKPTETKFSDMVDSETMKKINKEIRDGNLVIKQ